MYGLTQLGVIHTLISLVAVAAGVAAFLRDGRIDRASGVGKRCGGATVRSRPHA